MIRLLILIFFLVSSLGFPQTVDVLTDRYDNGRTGANLRETVLNVKNVTPAQFSKKFACEVDGDIYAQPLVKGGVQMPGVGARDVVYVATVRNSLYAFDASDGKLYWHVTAAVLGDPISKTNVTDLPATQEYKNFDNYLGIVATPVIDEKSGTIYVVAQSVAAGQYRFRLQAFDVASGREKSELHSPVEIHASAVGNGVGNKDGRLEFQARKMLNRPGLLLVGGILYLAFTTHLDGEPSRDSHGWVLAYDAKALAQLAALCTTPDGIQGGIWQSGAGLSADETHKPFPLIYAVVGNGSVGGRNVSQSILQLYPGILLSVKQKFTPAEQAYQNDHDLDLCTGALLVPGTPLVVGCSKQGKCYVVDRNNFRLLQELEAGTNSYGGERPSNIHGTPVVWRDAKNNLRLYVWGEEDFMRVFEYDGAHFSGVGKSTMRAPEKSMPGGMLTLSANGGAEDSGIVWATMPISGDSNQGTVAGILRAFDATHPDQELWNSEMNPGRDGVGMFAKFCPPVVANGMVYVATFANYGEKGKAPNKLVVYGLK